LEYLSTGEAAKYLNVHVNTLRYWHKKGYLNPISTRGGHRRYDKSEVLKLINQFPIKLGRKIKFKIRQSVGKIGGS
jgi:excisionase family DNA binding protein